MGGLDALDYTLLITAATAGFGYFYFKKQNAPKIPEKLSDLRSKTNANSLIKYLNSLGKEQLVILFYGSQTGTAEDFATRTQNDISSRLDIPTVLIDPEDYDLEDLKEIDQSKDWVCGFFMATYGEGEPTDNSTEFYDWVMNGQGQMADKGDQEDEMVEDQVLQGLSYFVFGLGNKTYEYYNAIGRRLDKRLAQLGANRIGTYGEGDDDDSLEGDYLKWAPTLVKSLAEHFQVKEKISDGSAPHIPLFHAVAREHAPEEGTRILAKGPKDCRILHSRILFKDSFDKYSFSDETKVVVKSSKARAEGNTVVIPRQCYHVEFDVSGMKYTTGDHLGVYASNNAGSVAKLAKFLGFRDSDICFDLIPNPEHRLHETAKANIDSPFHLCNVLTHRLDIESILKQHHFEILAKYTEDKEDSNYLYSLSVNRDIYLENIEKGQKTLSCILDEFSSIKLPLGVAVAEILRPIAVRYYSISSSSIENPDIVSVTAVIVRYALQQEKLLNRSMKKVVLKQGLATSWLEKLHDEYSLDSTKELYCSAQVRYSTFRLPKNHQIPIIMVGPGTGVAPFRGFIRERVHLATQGEAIGPTLLFYGCRNQESDYLYRDEFQSLESQIQQQNLNMQLKIITAFSRDGPLKVYVQTRIKEFANDIWQLLYYQNAYFYLCGDAKNMAHDVTKALEEISIDKLGKAKGAKFLRKLKEQNRFHEDVW